MKSIDSYNIIISAINSGINPKFIVTGSVFDDQSFGNFVISVSSNSNSFDICCDRGFIFPSKDGEEANIFAGVEGFSIYEVSSDALLLEELSSMLAKVDDILTAFLGKR